MPTEVSSKEPTKMETSVLTNVVNEKEVAGSLEEPSDLNASSTSNSRFDTLEYCRIDYVIEINYTRKVAYISNLM